MFYYVNKCNTRSDHEELDDESDDEHDKGY